MSDTKIADLTEYTTPIGTDVVPIVDVTNNQTKKISITNLVGSAGGSGEPLWCTGVTFPRVFGSNLSTGNTDLYTVPSGKRAIFLGLKYFNASGGTVVLYPEVKISGTYYKLSRSVSITTATGGNANPTTSIVLEAGESIAINCATTAGLNALGVVVEFDDTSPLKGARNFGLSSGNNTLLTVPSGKTALGYQNILSTTNNVATIAIVNDTGDGTHNYVMYNVPSGGSPGSSNQFYQSLAVNDGLDALMAVIGTMGAGDSVVINTDSGTAKQYAWFSYYEV